MAYVEQPVSLHETAMPKVRALERGLRLLSEVIDSDQAMGVNELARVSRLPKGTVSRLLATLVGCGYLTCSPGDGRYSPGPEVIRRMLGPNLTSSFKAAARDAMTRLRDTAGETVAIHVPVWPDRVCLEQVESLSGLRRIHNIGEPNPLTVASPGRCYLAFAPEDEVKRTLAVRPPTHITPYTITDTEEFMADLAGVRAVGYAIAVSETIVGMCGVAAPVFGQTGKPIAMISIAGPEVRWDRQAMVEFAPILLEATARLSLDSGPAQGGCTQRLPRSSGPRS